MVSIYLLEKKEENPSLVFLLSLHLCLRDLDLIGTYNNPSFCLVYLF